ncbi:MAG TPA: 2-dehydropantoate 2-reductase [Ramlibacter sp.]|nr:2-dehydropantoate 2-reductase [Ramlibacter sp.]
MDIAIVGAGAIGCRIAGHLAQRGTAATLFDTWGAHVAALDTQGLVLENADGSRERFAVRARGFENPPAHRFDLVMLAVRSDGTEAALPLVRRLLKDDGCVLSCQNGLNEEAIAAAVGAQRTLGCSLVFGAKLVAPGHVMVLPGPDVLRTGELVGGTSERLERIVALLGACGTSAATPNLLGYRWMKLVLNGTGNTLLLLTGLDAHALHAREDARRAIIAVAGEILATAIAAGVTPEPVLEVEAQEWVAALARTSTRLHEALAAHGAMLGGRRLSMVADFEARGRTEVDHINGFVVHKAKSLGRAAPLNERVWRMVREMERGERQAGLQAIEELLRTV